MSDETTNAGSDRAAMIFAYLNGTLSEEDHVRFEAMVGREPALAEEVNDWRNLRHKLAMRRDERAPDAGLAAFSRQLRTSRPRRESGIAKRFEIWMQAVYSPLRYGVALLLVVVQAGFIAANLGDSSNADLEPALSSVNNVRSIGNASTASLRVRFRPDATARAITAALANAGAHIADGPGQGGFYELKLGDASSPSAIDTLRNSAVVDELIEGAKAGASDGRPRERVE